MSYPPYNSGTSSYYPPYNPPPPVGMEAPPLGMAAPPAPFGMAAPPAPFGMSAPPLGMSAPPLGMSAPPIGMSPPPPAPLEMSAPQPPAPYQYPYYAPAAVMVPVAVGPMQVPADSTNQPTYITNYIYHGADSSNASLPPMTDSVSVVECSGDYDWIPTTSTTANQLTGRAVVGGHEGWDGSPLWVIRAWHEGNLLPGKYAVRHCAATITNEGKEIPVQNIEVLCAKPENLRWLPAANGNVPPGAIVAGRTSSGESLYVGRARYQLSVTPGMVYPSRNCCFISFTGTQVSHKMYDVLCRIS